MTTVISDTGLGWVEEVAIIVLSGDLVDNGFVVQGGVYTVESHSG